MTHHDWARWVEPISEAQSGAEKALGLEQEAGSLIQQASEPKPLSGRHWKAFLTEEEWKCLKGALEKTRAGDKKPIAAVCEMLESMLKAGIELQLKKRGVRSQDLDDAFHDVVHRVREEIEQLGDAENFLGFLFGIVKDLPTQYLAQAVQKARMGDENAAAAVCEMMETMLRPEIKVRLKKLGVRSQDLDDAFHDVVVSLLKNINQLRYPEAFKVWLLRIAQDVAKQYRRAYGRTATPEPEQEPERPQQTGTKTVLVNRERHVVRVFESCVQREQRSRQALEEPLIDSIILRHGRPNGPNYVAATDIRRALARLPERWARAIYLRQVEGYTAEEAAKILSCSVERISRLVQKGKERLRLLLPAYARNGSIKSRLRSYKSRRTARLKSALPLSTLPPRRCWVLIRLRLSGRSADHQPQQVLSLAGP